MVKILRFIKANLDIVLAATACAGVATTAVMAHKDTKKAAENDKGIKNYIPTAVAGVATCAAIVGMDILHVRKEKVLLAMAGMSELAVKKYETMSDLKEARELQGDGHIDNEYIGEVMGSLCEEIHESYSDSSAKMPCYDPYTKTFFKASQTDLLLAEREINSTLMNGGGTRVIDFIARFEPQAEKWIDTGNVGWWMDDNYAWNSSFFGYYLTMLPKIEEVEGRQCLVIHWSHEPEEMEEGFLPIS